MEVDEFMGVGNGSNAAAILFSAPIGARQPVACAEDRA